MSANRNEFGRTNINNPDIHPERLTRKIRNIPHVIANIAEGNEPMEYGRPNASPTHKARINGHIVELDDVVNGVVEKRNEASDTDDSERLCTKNAENHGCQGRRKEGFVDTVEFARSAVHVKSICNCR